MSDRYNPTTPESIDARLIDLRAKLKARSNTKGFEENVIAIEAEIARLESLAAAPRP